jgi:hypothetical protein
MTDDQKGDALCNISNGAKPVILDYTYMHTYTYTANIIMTQLTDKIHKKKIT